MDRIYELQGHISWLLRDRREMNERLERQTAMLCSHVVRNGVLSANNDSLLRQNAEMSVKLSMLQGPQWMFNPSIPPPPYFQPNALFNLPPPPPPILQQQIPVIVNGQVQEPQQQQGGQHVEAAANGGEEAVPMANVGDAMPIANGGDVMPMPVEGAAVRVNYQECLKCFGPSIWRLQKCSHAFLCERCFRFNGDEAVIYEFRNRPIIGGFFRYRYSQTLSKKASLARIIELDGPCQRGPGCQCTQCHMKLQINAHPRELICPFCAIASARLIREPIPPPDWDGWPWNKRREHDPPRENGALGHEGNVEQNGLLNEGGGGGNKEGARGDGNEGGNKKGTLQQHSIAQLMESSNEGRGNLQQGNEEGNREGEMDGGGNPKKRKIGNENLEVEEDLIILEDEDEDETQPSTSSGIKKTHYIFK